MQKIDIKNGNIHHHSEWVMPDKDNSWTLAFEDIRVIGLINRMDGDDDSDFILFLDHRLHKYFLCLTRPAEGLGEMNALLKERFNVDTTVLIQDRAIIVYPPELANRPLYKKSLKKAIKTTLGMTHVADGELADAVVYHINTLR